MSSRTGHFRCRHGQKLKKKEEEDRSSEDGEDWSSESEDDDDGPGGDKEEETELCQAKWVFKKEDGFYHFKPHDPASGVAHNHGSDKWKVPFL